VPSYYLRYFYAHDNVLAEQRQGVPRAAQVAEIERELLELYRDPELAEKPALLEQRGGAFYSEAAVGLIASLVAGNGEVHEVDVRNDGVLQGLADDDVVEVPARVFPDRIDSLPSSSTSRPTSASRCERLCPGSRPTRARRCSRIRSSASGTTRGS
jgi:6-phospho-beta-glucosidase